MLLVATNCCALHSLDVENRRTGTIHHPLAFRKLHHSHDSSLSGDSAELRQSCLVVRKKVQNEAAVCFTNLVTQAKMAKEMVPPGFEPGSCQILLDSAAFLGEEDKPSRHVIPLDHRTVFCCGGLVLVQVKYRVHRMGDVRCRCRQVENM